MTKHSNVIFGLLLGTPDPSTESPKYPWRLSRLHESLRKGTEEGFYSVTTFVLGQRERTLHLV